MRQPSAEEWLWAQDHLDSGAITLDDAEQIVAWAKFFKSTPDDLTDAVRMVGTNPNDISGFLARRSRN